MIEKRVECIEVMVSDLIRMVGITRAMVEEVRDDVRGLRVKLGDLEGKQSGQEGKVDSPTKDVHTVLMRMAARDDIRQLNERLDVHMDLLARWIKTTAV